MTVNRSGKLTGPRKYIDFSSDSAYPRKFDELVRAIHDLPAVARPSLGQSQFSGVAVPDASSARTTGPSGLTPGGGPVLDESWFKVHADLATSGLGVLPGSMELRFALHDAISKSQIELLTAIKAAENQTFGWPLGIVLDSDDWKPKPVSDGIVAEVKISEDDGISGAPSYDYWAIRKNGDFFLLQSLFEDQRGTKKMFADTRVVRVTEALMLCEGLYRNLGVAEDARVSIQVTHRGLAGRTLTVASSRRHLRPRTTAADVSQSQIVVSLAELQSKLTDHVIQIVEPLLMLFDYMSLDRKVYEDLVTDFRRGRIV